MPNEIAYNKGWNNTIVGLARNESDGTIGQYIAKLQGAMENIKMTHYFKGVFDCLKEYQEAHPALELVAA